MRTTQTPDVRHSSGRWLYALLVALLAAVIVGGYGLFRVFVTGVMPNLGAYNLLALAIIAGVASFFSPCAFPMLPGYLAVYAGVGQPAEESSPRRSAVTLGGAAALGVVDL